MQNQTVNLHTCSIWPQAYRSRLTSPYPEQMQQLNSKSRATASGNTQFGRKKKWRHDRNPDSDSPARPCVICRATAILYSRNTNSFLARQMTTTRRMRYYNATFGICYEWTIINISAETVANKQSNNSKSVYKRADGRDAANTDYIRLMKPLPWGFSLAKIEKKLLGISEQNAKKK